jgi:alanyl-tRNA synthetase
LITETLKLEETRFKDTLGRGLKLLEDEVSRLGDQEPLSGDVAFKLYDTFGFPLDLTQDILRGQGRGVDTQGFEASMDQQRATARKAWSGSGEAATEALWFTLEDELGSTEFLGYEAEEAEGQVVALVVDGKPVERIEAGQEAAVLTNQTPFYGESGGQMGDSGALFSAEGASFSVADTQKKLGSLHVHLGKLERGSLEVGEAVELRVDAVRRARLRANHSATHLLHEALRRRLGDHVTQKGSLVAPDRLRFDISHPKPLTREDIVAVEKLVNETIVKNAEVTTRYMTPEEAIEEGALALFGEKYGDEVRVVSMGGADRARDDKAYSTELCGGTHVRRVGDIGFFKIIREEALASGVRRLEAVTGVDALAYVEAQEEVLADTAATLRSAASDLPQRVAALMEERKRLEREVGDLRRKLATGGGSGQSGPKVKDIGGIKFIGQVLEGVSARDLKPMADTLKQQVGSGVVALIAVSDGKASLVAGVTDDLTATLSAVDLVRAGSQAIGGKGGGGRPDMAQAGGPDSGNAAAAIQAIEAALAG